MKGVRYKERVLARFPNAKTAITSFWRDGSPRHYTIIAGNLRLESGSNDWWDNNSPQDARKAWHAAYLWCVANPGEGIQNDLFDQERKEL